MGLKVQITSPVGGSTPVVLGNTPDPLPMSGVVGSVESIIQQDPLYGSLSQFLNYLGNDLFHETFEVHRNADNAGVAFANPATAAAWARTHLINCPRFGLVEFIYTVDVTATFTFAYGTIVPIQIVKQDGCTLTLRYTIKGTNLTQS